MNSPGQRQNISNTGGLGLMPKHVWKGVLARDGAASADTPSFNTPIGSPETSYSRNIMTALESRERPSTVFSGQRQSIYGDMAPGSAPQGRRSRKSGLNFNTPMDSLNTTGAEDSLGALGETDENAMGSPKPMRRRRTKTASIFGGAKEDKTSNRYSFNSSALRNLKRRDGGMNRRPPMTAPQQGSPNKVRQGGLRRAGKEVDSSLFLDTEVGKLQGQISRLLNEVEKLKIEKEDLQGQLSAAQAPKSGVDGASGMLAYKRVKQRYEVPRFNRKRHRGVQTGGGEMASEARIAQLLHKNPQLKELAEAIASATGGELYNLVKLVTIHIRKLVKADRCTAFLASRESNELWALQAGEATGLSGTHQKYIRIPLYKADKQPNGISGSVTVNCESVNIEDAYNDDRFDIRVDKKLGYRTKSVLCVPVVAPHARESKGAIMCLNKLGEEQFSIFDQEILEAAASLTAVAIERAEMTKKADQLYKLCKTIRDMTTGDTFQTNIREAALRTMSVVKELIGAERASLYVVDPVRRELWTPIAGVEGMTEIRLPLAIDGAWVTDDTPIILGVDHKEHKRDGIAVHCVTYGEVIMVQDANQHASFNPKMDILSGFKTKSVLCYPLYNQSHSQVLGAIQLLNKQSEDDSSEFTFEDKGLVEVIATLVSDYIDSSRVSAEYVKEKSIGSMFLESVKMMYLEKDLRQLLVKIARCCRAILYCDRATVFLVDRPNKQLRKMAGSGWVEDEGGPSEEDPEGGDGVSPAYRSSSGPSREKESFLARRRGSLLDAREFSIPWDSGIAGYVFMAQKIRNVTDVNKDPYFDAEMDRKSGMNTTSILCVPIVSRSGATIGVVQCINKISHSLIGDSSSGGTDERFNFIKGSIKSKNSSKISISHTVFSKHDEQLAECITSIAAVSIENIGGLKDDYI
ncbi:GAF domain-containing protein [Chloropicon primus]|uniref:GAF domain-containing protein n=1 Tax=Chloropicon primus TaxID=1764295 RepID=A0A5B8MTK0_9CHLO|nr:hypothetical protein A3770_09p54930 [Chloropicon primus]UPR02192.1 GAF domain-containing protein [Chloropicon primus]|eukprot:QDZ22975.1 hypothetical protein A3770_09p54930 [Chloropicon primus]